MSANPTASEYLLLFRNNAWYQDLAPEVIEASMNRFTAWADQLSREGKLKSGGPLETIGKTLTGRNMVIDGPFAESKEAVAGFFVIQAARSMHGARSPILRRSRFAKSTSISFEPSGPKARSEPQLRRAARLHTT